MKKVEQIMNMPVTVEVKSERREVKIEEDIRQIFSYFKEIDEKYSPFKSTSEVGKYNRGEKVSREMLRILDLCEETKKMTNGYFDIKKRDGTIDPSGLVKGWSIKNAADILRKKKYQKFYVDVAGDAEIVGKNWKWGIRNPFDKNQIIKVLKLSNCGIATSGTYERGQHVWDPVTKRPEISDIVSITVVGENVYEADRFATAAFAMGLEGINFVETLKGFEGYMINSKGMATMTSGFEKYVSLH